MIAQKTRPSVIVKEPLQKRSRRSLDRIVAASERLLETREFDDLSVEEIVSAARVSIGSFYARFTGKEALLPLLHERYRQTMDEADATLQNCPITSLEACAKHMIAAQVARFRKHRGLLRTLAFRERSTLTEFNRQMVAWARLATRRRVAALLQFVQQIKHPNPQKAIENALYFMMATLREKVLFANSPHARITKLSDRALVHELTHMLVSYLCTPSVHDSSLSQDQ